MKSNKLYIYILLILTLILPLISISINKKIKEKFQRVKANTIEESNQVKNFSIIDIFINDMIIPEIFKLFRL